LDHKFFPPTGVVVDLPCSHLPAFLCYCIDFLITLALFLDYIYIVLFIISESSCHLTVNLIKKFLPQHEDYSNLNRTWARGNDVAFQIFQFSIWVLSSVLFTASICKKLWVAVVLWLVRWTSDLMVCGSTTKLFSCSDFFKTYARKAKKVGGHSDCAHFRDKAPWGCWLCFWNLWQCMVISASLQWGRKMLDWGNSR